MIHDHSIAVVIPCYQAARTIRAVVGGLPPIVDLVIVVDDGSTDEGVRALEGGDARVVVVKHASNQGVGAAMVTGLRAAVERGADVIVKMDADLQMDPAELPRLCAPIVRGEADLCKGNRFVHRRTLRGMPKIRVIGNLGLSFLTKAASGYWNIFDPTNGYIAMRRELVDALDMTRLSRRYFFECSLLIESYLTGAVVKDVGMASRYGDEPSALSVSGALTQFPFLLMRGMMRRVLTRYFLRDFSAVSLFSVTGAVLMVGGGWFGAWKWYQNYGSGVPTPAGTVVLAVVPLLVGFQLVLQALVIDITNVPRESPWIRERTAGQKTSA